MALLNNVIYLENALSTNTFLKISDYPDRTIVYTFDQKEGRGREDRKWLNFKDKNLALSLLFKPEENVKNYLWYIAVNSLALIKLLENYGIKSSYIKWPNDIYIDDKKISGILAESTWKGQKTDKLIIGIGVNVNSSLDDIKTIDKKATSLFIETNKVVNIKLFTEEYIGLLNKYYGILLLEKNIDYIKEEWMNKSKIIGKKVCWVFNGNEIYGEASDIDEEGFLMLKTESGLLKVLSGDINLV